MGGVHVEYSQMVHSGRDEYGEETSGSIITEIGCLYKNIGYGKWKTAYCRGKKGIDSEKEDFF